MNICEKLISSCISVDCNNSPFTGLEQTAYIFNFQHVTGYTVDPSNPNLITDLEMAELSEGVSATGYRIINLGRTPFTGTNTGFTAGNVSNKFLETVSLVVPDTSASAAHQIDMIANGKFIIVLQNSYAGSDETGRWQIYGLKKGLVASDIVRDPYNEDNDGVFAVTLTSEGCPNSAMFLQHATDTLAYLQSITDDCTA